MKYFVEVCDTKTYQRGKGWSTLLPDFLENEKKKGKKYSTPPSGNSKIPVRGSRMGGGYLYKGENQS